MHCVTVRRKLEEYSVQLLGECAIANYKFAKQPTHSIFPIAVEFGIGIYSAIMITGPVTGAHIDPAVSISLVIARKLKPFQCIFNIVGQMLGAFLAKQLNKSK
ncbi:hypothetical protein I4U23_016598 [Adineta vaga]|nr:hypothetical protein I4U23_016598 [Adineta vaga]